MNTPQGGIKTRDTNIRKYGEDYYARIGAIGGSRKVRKGFAVSWYNKRNSEANKAVSGLSK